MIATTATIGFVDSDTIELRLELGQVIDAIIQPRVPAGLAPPDDEGWIRDSAGGLIGRVQLDGTSFMPVDVFRPSAIDHLFWLPWEGPRRSLADDISLWRVTVNGTEVDLTGLARKAHLTETAMTANWDRFSTVQNIFLDLDTPLAEGDIVRIRLDDAAFRTLKTTFAPATTISEAVHVNLTGHDPDDIRKIGFLSSWNGWQLDPGLPEGGRGVPQVWDGPLTFHLVDEATGARVFTGQTVLAAAADAPTDLDTNFAGTDVWQMDFSAFDGTGTFHLMVEGVGRSQSFGMNDTHWSGIFETAFSGFYHARSGIALDDLWTDWTRARSLHPDDGIVTVLATDVTLIETSNGYLWDLPADKFAQVVNGATTEVVDGAWGGWHDAGDWDRRTQHMEPARQLLELLEFAPGGWGGRAQGAIPETVNTTPDLIDEAAWGLGVFRRMQTEEGGIRGGIEGDRYRDYGAGSWFEPTPLFAYAPDIWSSWEYAASAARLARLLEPYDPAGAAGWLDSATRAMTWAEAERRPWVAENGRLHPELQDARNLAALEMYAATGEARWHDLFKATSAHRTDRDLAYDQYQTEAAFHYAMLDPALTDPVIAARARANFLEQVQWYLDTALNSGFGYSFNPYNPNSMHHGAATPTDAAHYFVRAHMLTGEDRFLSAAINEVQYALGANPMNMAFLTGLDGIRSPQEILHADANSLGRDPPPGIVIYGESRYGLDGRVWYHDVMEPYVWPLFHQRPDNETYNGYWGFVPSSEFTVMRSVSDMAYVTGYLAALNGDEAGPLRQGGGEGRDTIRGDDGDNRLEGQGGDDVLVAGAGRDLVFGGNGHDMLHTGQGNDGVWAGEGHDTVRGGGGNDHIYGQGGKDRLVGGAGSDVFVFDTAPGPGNIDRIVDFEAGFDVISLDATIFRGLTIGRLAATAFVSDATGQTMTSSPTVIHEPDSGRLFFDSDGQGPNARVQFAVLRAEVALSAVDFVVF